MNGGCGLNGQCVECFADVHCPGGLCDDLGRCRPAECVLDGDCPADRPACREARCVKSCLQAADCAGDELCEEAGQPGLVCHAVRCKEYGSCGSRDFWPTPGSLRCHFEPCPMTGLMKGVCGLATACLECILDADCPAGKVCSVLGVCEDFPVCPFEPGWTSCSRDEVCVGGLCTDACTQDRDCDYRESGRDWYSGICGAEGGCAYERCGKDGECPAGWKSAHRGLKCIQQHLGP
jgi:hypothetical protein